MSNATLIALSAVASLAFANGAAVAQDRTTQSRQASESARREAEAARATEQARREKEEARRASLQEELDRARDEMEQAAQEVARLSAEYAGPVVRDVAKRFSYAGQRAMLGLNISDTDEGARVNGVSPNGPAAEAGLKVGDVIVSIDDARLLGTGASQQSPSEVLLAQMRNVEAGKPVKLGILRDGKPQDVTVRTRELGPGQFFSAPLGCSSRPGDDACFSLAVPGPNTWQRFFVGYNPWRQMQLVALTPELGTYFGTDAGLLVVRGPGDPELGLRDGDVIIDIGGREPSSPEHALRILASFEPGEKLEITIMRKQRRQTLDVMVPAPDTERG